MAVQDIWKSLEDLAQSVEALEKDVNAMEKAGRSAAKQPVSAQIDMFGGWPPKPANDKHTAILAQKLDHTIDKVQNLLRGAGA